MFRPMTRLLLTTNPGLEGIVAAELATRLADAGLAPAATEKRPYGLDGHVLARHPAPVGGLLPAALRLRSVHHVLNPLYTFELSADALAGIDAELERRGVPALEAGGTFRVTTKRYGEHDFGSEDVQRAAGTALVRRYGLKVDLTGYDTNVRVDIYQNTCSVGLQHTRDSLSKRWNRVYSPRPALKSTVAYALLHLARVRPYGGPVLDPFCGSGTTLFEAAALYPGLGVFGSDLFERVVQGARANAEANGLQDRLSIKLADAVDLADAYPHTRFQAIVADPPYGVRQGRRLNFYWLYIRFLSGSRKILEPGGRIVVVVWKRALFERVLRDMDCFVVRQVLAVEVGGIYPKVFVLVPK